MAELVRKNILLKKNEEGKNENKFKFAKKSIKFSSFRFQRVPKWLT